MTISEAIENGPAVCLMGEGRVYAIGDIAYRFKRPDPFPNGMGQTLPTFAAGVPVMYVDGKWQPTQLARSIIRNWTDKVTVLT
jgi:hypothetical protein